jgi:hypothetical protein
MSGISGSPGMLRDPAVPGYVGEGYSLNIFAIQEL